ncbi:MAG: hypothetical protein N3D11_09190 [Candidatus Sumerlaeia bacterium]|nr:hypothetical protein [Candidatus Sumerlaeia bacterium]
MLAKRQHNGQRGQTRQEALLILLVCAIALTAALSVFVPAIRRLWVALGRSVLGYEGSSTARDLPAASSTGENVQGQK